MSTQRGSRTEVGRAKRHLKVWVARFALGALGLLLIVEALSNVVVSTPPLRIRRFLYVPPKVSREDFETYLSLRDPILGWPLKEGSTTSSALSEARPSPANAKLAGKTPCISLYGETITYGYDVSDESVWGNMLAQSLGCPVSNFGVNGYSVTQSVLRFLQNKQDDALVTILAIQIESINYNMNQWHYLINPFPTLYAGVFGFRPTLSSQTAQIIPPPIESYTEFVQMTKRPASILSNELYLPDSTYRYAPVIASFPYTLTLLRILWKIAAIDFSVDFFRVPVSDWNLPYWHETQDGMPSETIGRLADVLRLFQQGCADRGKKCAILLLPDPDTVHYRNVQKKDLARPIAGVSPPAMLFWDSIDAFAAADQTRGYCNFVGRERDCRGYLNEDGHALLHDFVLKSIQESITR